MLLKYIKTKKFYANWCQEVSENNPVNLLKLCKYDIIVSSTRCIY